MIRIGVKNQIPIELNGLTSPIFKFKFYVYQSNEEIIDKKDEIDIYLFQIDENIEQLNTELRAINDRATFIYYAKTEEDLAILQELQPCYFVYKTINKDHFCKMINNIAQSLRYKSCIVETSVGEKIVKIKDINYVNIEDRSACYHLNTGNTIKSLKLRTSFNKATNHLLVNTNLYFLSPGLILNLENIENINQSFVNFKNGSNYPIPKKSEDLIRETWLKALTE